jgi:hypothetical protein
MKYLFLLFSVFTLVGCGEQQSSEKSFEPQKESVPFRELQNEEQKEVIIENIKDYVNQNDSLLAFQNYFFLLEQSNEFKNSPVEPLSNIKVLFNDTIVAELLLVQLASYEYLKQDDRYGELDTYGITFVINDSTGAVESYSAHANFVKWDNGKIGERNSLSEKYLEYGDKIPDIELIYSN